MKFTFDIKAKEALNELIKNSSENYSKKGKDIPGGILLK